MIVAATGHRPNKIGGYEWEAPQRVWVRQQIKQSLIELRPDKCISGMALGVDQDFAFICATLGIPKEELLGLLSDVQGMVGGFATNDVYQKSKELGCGFIFHDAYDEKHKKIEKYMNETRSSRHDWKVDVINVWSLNVKGQKEKHVDKMKEAGNIKPLFHGSRPQNILGICKHGLLMRPPGVYITGSMFGNGLYFADQSSKSEQYSFGGGYGSRYGKDTYFMFVADVALGKIKGYQNAQSHLMSSSSMTSSNTSSNTSSSSEQKADEGSKCCALGCGKPLQEPSLPFCEKHMQDEALIKAWNEL